MVWHAVTEPEGRATNARTCDGKIAHIRASMKGVMAITTIAAVRPATASAVHRFRAIRRRTIGMPLILIASSDPRHRPRRDRVL